MNVVLYTEDFEPITVLDLPQWTRTWLWREGSVIVPVLLPPQYVSLAHRWIEPPQQAHVRICSHVLRFPHGVEHLLLTTADEEAALMLRSTLLPGQHADVQALGRQQYTRGFIAGLIAAAQLG